MSKRVPQPPVNRDLRPIERHDFWPGFVIVLIGAILAVAGLRRLTGVDTVNGDSATEIQLMKAFASSGLQYADQLRPPPPPNLADPAAQAEAMNRWAQQQANATVPSWKIRVDTAAKAPCPT